MDFHEIVAAAEARLLASLENYRAQSRMSRAKQKFQESEEALAVSRARLEELRAQLSRGLIGVYDFEGAVRQDLLREQARNQSARAEMKAITSAEKTAKRAAEANVRLERLNK